MFVFFPWPLKGFGQLHHHQQYAAILLLPLLSNPEDAEVFLEGTSSAINSEKELSVSSTKIIDDVYLQNICLEDGG